MKQGFVFALITLVLFTTLLALVVSIRTERSQSGSWMQDMMNTRKLLYTSDDIAEDVRYATGSRIVRSGDTLFIYDHLPASVPVDQKLRGYGEFVKTRYLSADMRVQFYDDAGNEIELDSLSPELVIYPYNDSYSYQDYGKRELSVGCGAACTNTTVEAIALEFNLTNLSFDWNPVPGNESHYYWAPNFLSNGTCHFDTCINFTLTIRDKDGRVYSCPGPLCNYTQFQTDRKSAIDIASAPCWFELRLGDSPDNLYVVRLHQPNDTGAECSSDVDTAAGITFPGSDYYLNMPGFVRVTDVNYNSSRLLAFPGENISARELAKWQQGTHSDSECFLADGSSAWAGGSRYDYVYGVRVSNTCSAELLTITKMRVSWVVNSNEQMEVIRINGTSYWDYNGLGSPNGKQRSGTLIDMVDYSMNPLTTTNLTYLKFSRNDMRGKNFTVVFTFGDGTSKNITFRAA